MLRSDQASVSVHGFTGPRGRTISSTCSAVISSPCAQSASFSASSRSSSEFSPTSSTSRRHASGWAFASSCLNCSATHGTSFLSEASYSSSSATFGSGEPLGLLGDEREDRVGAGAFAYAATAWTSAAFQPPASRPSLFRWPSTSVTITSRPPAANSPSALHAATASSPDTVSAERCSMPAGRSAPEAAPPPAALSAGRSRRRGRRASNPARGHSSNPPTSVHLQGGSDDQGIFQRCATGSASWWRRWLRVPGVRGTGGGGKELFEETAASIF